MALLPLVVYSLALLCGTAAPIAVGILYLKNRTAVLSHFLFFLVSLFLFVLSFWINTLQNLNELSDGLLIFLTGLELGLTAIASILQILILPYLLYGVFKEKPPRWARILSFSNAAGILIFTSLRATVSKAAWILYVLSSLLYGTIGLYLLITIKRFLAKNGTNLLAKEGKNAFISFLTISLIFFPLFILDILNYLGPFNNLPTPVYLMIVSISSVLFAYSYLGKADFSGTVQITEKDKKYYGLTEREFEVAEFILEGFTVPDAARALKLKSKTVENHLYAVYKKTGVTNRLQLFTLFKNT